MNAVVEELRATVGKVVTDPDATLAYSRDQCAVAHAGVPKAVVLAGSIADVLATVKAANTYRVPLIPRGAGTGLSGGANAVDGCIVLDLSRMDRVFEIDPLARTARVQPGVINGDLDAKAREHGLRYIPDPGSRAISSIGGNLATNAGGMCCAKYGVTGDHVFSLTAVTGAGDLITTGALSRKNVVGLDLTRLLIGSEGTLAVLVEAVVKLLPVPLGHATLATSFRSIADAVAAAADWTKFVVPAAVELMDRTTVRAVNDLTRSGLDEDAGAIVIAQFDGRDASADADRCADLAREFGAEVFVTNDPREGEGMMAVRRAALAALETKGATLLDDVAVPAHRLPALLDAIEAVSCRLGVTIGTFGHLADGNLHPTIVYDAADPASKDRALDAFRDIVEAALALDGTMSGEHGVGSLKADLVSQQVGQREQSLMRGIKRVFDPQGILNPGRAY